jgi:hypothetical protein
MSPEVRSCVHKSPPLVPIPSLMNQGHILTPFKIHFNIIRDSLLVFRKKFARISHHYHACYIHYPPHPPWYDHSNNIRWRVQIMKFLITQFSPTSCSLLLGTNTHRTWYAYVTLQEDKVSYQNVCLCVIHSLYKQLQFCLRNGISY